MQQLEDNNYDGMGLFSINSNSEASSKRKNKRTIKRDGISKRQHSPGCLEKEIAMQNPTLALKHKEMEENSSLYTKDYDKYHVETIAFKTLYLGQQWNILAVDQTSSD